MQEEKKKKTTHVTSDEIAQFLEQTGFVFEMRAKEVLEKYGYECDISVNFVDLEGDTTREIDILAVKDINDIKVHLIIECKQSALDKWIFICTKESERWLYSVKHIPHVGVTADPENDPDPFSNLHYFNRKIPLAHNYICYSIATERKAEHIQIDKCVHALPKAVVNFASDELEGRHLFFPIALFAGQLFSMSYKGALSVSEQPFIQYYRWFASEAYKVEPEEVSMSLHEMFSERAYRAENKRMLIRTAGALGPHYHLDFVTEKGLPAFLEIVEIETARINLKEWPLPIQKESGDNV